MATVRGFNQDGSWAQMEKKVFALDENGERIPEIDPKTGEQKVRTRTRNGVTSSEKLWKRITVQINNWNQRSFLNEVKREWAETCNRYLEPELHLVAKWELFSRTSSCFMTVMCIRTLDLSFELQDGKRRVTSIKE